VKIDEMLTSAAMCVVVDRAARIAFAGRRTAGATKPLATPSAATTEKARVLVIFELRRGWCKRVNGVLQLPS
jgi:hypothetical protein